jgi:hypothetical protein
MNRNLENAATGLLPQKATSEGKPVTYPEITFEEFRILIEKRRRTVDDLVDLFRGKIEDPRDFFDRLMSCRVKIDGHYEDRGNVVIPYRSVIDFYQRELGYQKASEAEEAIRAEKRKRGPVSEERRQALREHLARVRDLRKTRVSTREIIEEVI